LLVIRYLATEIRVFAYLKNLPLVASFLGIGAGMIIGRRERLERSFPFVVLALFALIRFAPLLHLTHVGFADVNYAMFGEQGHGSFAPYVLLRYLGVTIGILSLIIAFFAALGGPVGEGLTLFEPLRGYGINLLGSLAGILLFSLLAVLRTSPIVWLFVGCCSLIPFWRKRPLAIAAIAIVLLMQLAQPQNTFWSPYYRIDFSQLPGPTGYDRPSAYALSVNHDYHQRIVDLSPQFVSRYPLAEPNHTALTSYDLPYRLVSNPVSVLVVGAGTGNDVAAALRHGAGHVDAVEIDPVIQELGRKYHPEHPYDSPRVSVYIDDARAFFSKTHNKYDLIVFGYLDSHTLFSSFSSLRLDNYVYTFESIRAARSLLRPGGAMVLSFSGGLSFVNERLAATLAQAFGSRPLAFQTGYDGDGIVYLENISRNRTLALPYPEIGESLIRSDTVVTRDAWPFLYLRHRTIPGSILVVILLLIVGAHGLLKSSLGEGWVRNVGYLQMFFLGAGFMLLETRSVTELSLLFGSTWVVNAVVIGAFLTMGFLANVMVLARPMPVRPMYLMLFLSLIVSTILPASFFSASSVAVKVLAGGGLVAVPVLFSGIVFSSCFRFSSRPEKALAVNLFGAMAGGLLENVVMIGGMTSIAVLVFLLYAAAASAYELSKGSRDPIPEFS
jgi:SAM-dependent methyltransferase